MFIIQYFDLLQKSIHNQNTLAFFHKQKLKCSSLVHKQPYLQFPLENTSLYDKKERISINFQKIFPKSRFIMLWKPTSTKTSVRINFKIFIMVISLLFVTKIQSATIISNCMSYSSDGTKCLVCADYYHTFDGKCYPDVTNCKTYSSGTTCSSCSTNYFLLSSLNKCCDSVCLSQFYVPQQNSNQQIPQLLAQSSVLEAAIDKAYLLINLPISSVKLLNISYTKYLNVSRYFFLFQLSNSAITFQRFVLDYHYSLKQFILIDDSSYNSSQNTNFSQVFYSIVRTSTTVSAILQMFPSYYSQTDVNLALIKFSNSLNKITTYEVVLHNQNVIRGLYVYKNLAVLMFQTLLKPLSYRRVLFGKYLSNALNNVNYLSQSKSILDTNEGYKAYSNLTLRALVLVNSTDYPNYQRLTYFSQNSNSIVKSQFQILFTSLNNFKINLISLLNQRKSEPLIAWTTYFENQSPQINKILMLLFSGFNSTLQIPDNYVDDSNKRASIQWNLTIEQWKVFKRFYIRIEDKNGYQINATLVYLEQFSEYRIQSIIRTGPAKVLTDSALYSSSQSMDLNSQDIFTPFEHTIQGWSQIYSQSLQRQNIKKLLLIISTLSIHKALGSNSSIIKLTQKTSLTHNNYTSVSQNITHYLNLQFTNISSSNNLTLISYNFRAKKQLINPSPFFVKSDPIKKIDVYYRDNIKTIIYKNLTTEPASSLLLRFKNAWLKHVNDNKTVKRSFDTEDSIKYLLNLINNYPNLIVQSRDCPTSPTTTFILALKNTTYFQICDALHFQEITDFRSGQKNLILHGVFRTQGVCNYDIAAQTNGYLFPKISTTLVNKNIYYYSSFSPNLQYDISLSVNTSINATDRILKELSTAQNSSFFDRYKSFRLQNYSRTYSIYDYHSGFILNNFFMTDLTTNLTYEFVYYYRARNQNGSLLPLPSYLQSIKQQYFGICPPINIKAPYMTIKNQQINPWTSMNSSQFFQDYERLNPTGIFANNSITIKNLLYSQNDQSKLNSVMPLLPDNIRSLNYEVKQYIKLQYPSLKIYLWRLIFSTNLNNISSITQQDLIIIQQINSISNSTSSSPQLISWSPFVNKYLETYNIKTRSLFTDYIPIEFDLYKPVSCALYLQNTSGIANFYTEYYKDNLNMLVQADNKINQQITTTLLRYFPGNLSSLKQSSYQIQFKKVFYRATNITNEISQVTFILEVQNKSTISSQGNQPITFYLKLSAYIKSNCTVSLSNKIYNTFIFVLNIQSIQQGGNLNKFIKQNLYPLIQTVSNYSVGYNYKFYNDSKSSSVTNTSNTSGSISGNTTAPVLVSSNSNQTILRFYDIMNDKGKLILAGQLQSIKARVFDTANYSSIITTDLLNISIGSDLQKRLFNDFVLPQLLSLLQSQNKAINLTISSINNLSILLIQKVFDSSGFISFNIVIRVNVTTSSTPTFSLYLIRFTYIVVSNPFSVFNMGTQFLSTQEPAYSSFIANLNSTSSPYFKPLQIVSNLNYLSAFMYSTLDMINQYITDKNISQTDKAIKIIRIYYRGFIQGGFYKIVFETKEQVLGMGYMIEDDYEYSVLLVRLTEISTKNVINNTGTTSGNNTSTNGTNTLANGTNSSSNSTTDTSSNTTNNNNSTTNITPLDKNNLTPPSNSTSSTTNTTSSSTNTSSSTTNSTSSTNFTSSTNSTTNNTTTNSTNSFLNTTNPSFQPLSSLQTQLLNSSNPLHKTLIQILDQLRLFFSQQIKSSFLKQFSIKQFTDGQYYHLGLQNINSTDGKYIYFYDLMVFRCNLTQCNQYYQNLVQGAVVIVNFNKYQVLLADNSVRRTEMVNYLPWNMAQGQTGSSNTTNQNSGNIFFTNGSSTSSTYYLSPSQSLSILSLFQRMISTQSTSINYTASFQKYQKYLQYLFQYKNLILGSQINSLTSTNKKLITKNDITSKIINVINFVRQKYSVLLKEMTPLVIVQQQLVNQSLNGNSEIVYTLYLLVESVSNSVNNSVSWTIYKISVNTREITPKNVQMRIIAMNQFAKDGILLQTNTSNSNLNIEQTSSSSASDIAFGYSKVLLYDAMNDADIQYVLSYIKSIYPSYFQTTSSTLKSIQKLQLKNGTMNYKFIFLYPSNTSSSLQSQKQLKIIAVYKKQLKVVQILNKVYSLPTGDSSSFRPATASQTSNNNTIWASCINLIYQLHTSNNLIQKQISINQRVNILMVQISQKQRKVASANSTSYLGQTYKIFRYRVQFMTSQMKKYSSIIEYNPQQVNSFSEIYFSQIVEVMKDASYRLSQVQQADLQTYSKLTSQQIVDDPLYLVAENKLKQVATYYCKTLQVMKKAEGFGYSYKIVFLGDSLNLLNNLNGNTTTAPQVEPTLMFQTIVFVQPINSIVQIRQSPQKLDLTNNFDQSISKTVFNETDLNNIALNISSMINLNTQLREQIFFSQGGMKEFLDGFMIKFTFYVNRTLGRTQYFQVLVFKRLSETRNSLLTLPSTQIWNLKPTNFATFQSCSQTFTCTACSNPTFYSIFNNICFLRIANCLSYSLIDIKTGTLRCGICMPGYQLFDDRCIAKQNKVDIFVL